MEKSKIPLLLATVLLLCVTGCPTPSDPTGSPPSVPVLDPISLGDSVYVPQMNILENRLERIPAGTEYSVDDGSSWHTCSGTSTPVVFGVGDLVWIRPTGDDANKQFLGEIEALAGRPDLMAGDALHVGVYYSASNTWADAAHGVPGETRHLMFSFSNCGDTSGYSSSHKIRAYLSTDTTITAADDTLLAEISHNDIGDVYGGHDNPFTIPAVPPGVYYIGIIVDATDVIAELSEGGVSAAGANATQPDAVVEFRVGEPAASTAGAFKLVNSWGVGGWEEKPDGHYWITYASLKSQGLPVFYYLNDSSHVYEPTILAVFDLTHRRRDQCRVTLGVGDPAAPVATKDLMVHWGPELHSGAHPFPDNSMALDISEFASLVNDHDVFLAIDNTGSTACVINSFQVEFYADYDAPPFRIISGNTGRVPAGQTGAAYCRTEGTLSLSELVQISPLSRSVAQGAPTFVQTAPEQAELRADMATIGVYQEGRNYNTVLHGKYGTGLKPPTREAWGQMTKLRRINGLRNAGVFDNQSVDHSMSPCFPPVGDQGQEGSCVCFSFGYYIGTYLEAREHGWDLSSVSWVGDAPDSQRNRILSPDFLYHQINSGKDEGSYYHDAAAMLIQLGGASWQEMPYDTTDSTSWPSEAAFREAARYRGREVGNSYWGDVYSQYHGYFTVEDDDDIGLLLGLLEAGYCVSVSIDAVRTYDELDTKDVIDTTADFSITLNHAQTIVGFKDGTAWDPANPD